MWKGGTETLQIGIKLERAVGGVEVAARKWQGKREKEEGGEGE